MRRAIRDNELRQRWPEEVLQAAGALSAKLPLGCRRDLRAQAFVTIDGQYAADFDDAVYCEQQSADAWLLWVAIADVSHYVQPNSPLDREAKLRGNSSYLPGCVLPMLPERLSNELCSLQPEQERLVLVCRMEIGADGAPRGYRFEEAVIRSHMRLTYGNVERFFRHNDGAADALAEQDGDFATETYAAVHRSLHALRSLYDCQRAARAKRGSLDLELAQSVVEMHGQQVHAVRPVRRGISHRIIEECMLVANVCAADFLVRAKLPTLYRVHPNPQEEKVQQLRSFLEFRELQLGGGAKPQAQHFQQLVEQIRDREDAAMLQSLILRTMEKACYQARNAGHFALNYPAYLHFTSPIRRYPDLVVHRTIRYLLGRDSGAQAAHGAPPYDAAQLSSLGEHCSATERASEQAERDAQHLLKCLYLEDFVGEERNVRVSSVTDFGLFATIQEVQTEGLIHISDLPGGYYRYDAEQQCLETRRSGMRFSLGDTLRVRIAAVDSNAGKIALIPLDSDTGEEYPKRGGAGRYKRRRNPDRGPRGDEQGQRKSGRRRGRRAT